MSDMKLSDRLKRDASYHRRVNNPSIADGLGGYSEEVKALEDRVEELDYNCKAMEKNFHNAMKCGCRADELGVEVIDALEMGERG